MTGVLLARFTRMRVLGMTPGEGPLLTAWETRESTWCSRSVLNAAVASGASVASR